MGLTREKKNEDKDLLNQVPENEKITLTYGKQTFLFEKPNRKRTILSSCH